MWNVHALVEQIDGENVIQVAAFQLFHGFIAFGLRVLAGNGFRPVWSFRLLVHLPIKQVGKTLRLLTAAAKHQILHRGAGFADLRINFLFKLSCKTTVIGGGDLKVPFAIGIQCVNGEIRTTTTLMILRGIMASFLVGKSDPGYNGGDCAKPKD